MDAATVTQSGMLAANSNAIRNCTLPFDQDSFPLAALYISVLSVGLPANVVRRNNVLGIYLLGLSLCDLTYLCTLPLWAIYISAKHTWQWGPQACRVTGYVFFTNMYISIFLLCCVSIDRYVAVAYAVESQGRRGRRLAAAVTVAVCLVVAAGHLPVFTMQEGYTDAGRRCFEPGGFSATVMGFNYARFFVGFVIPLGILGFTNRAILANVQDSPSLGPRQKVKVKCLVVAIVALFLVCFGPYHVILLLRAIMHHSNSWGAGCDFEVSVYMPYTISLGLSTINSATNPILYVLSSDNIRQEIREGVWGSCCLCAGHQGSDSSQPRMNSISMNLMGAAAAANGIR
ncbi:hypothetical protein JZ751_010563 [Albula glossodonta]|uniref:G-protein coupled receptors family 1 profile domain-containing protein n=1 Tax=Albula glossodonta TaxID=121402 RepID=A0A8T2P5I5_9TELE|nr:hypothetical protein JZ751_010563 [Albula glossodonta]